MKTGQIFRQVSRATSVLRTNGPREFLNKIANKVREHLGIPSTAQRQYLQKKSALDRAFDGGSGTDTGGIQRLHNLTINSSNARFGTSHIASDPIEFSVAIRLIDIPINDFTFIDLGSGKGRGLMLALDFPFKRVLGIEFAQELHDISCANVASLATTDHRASLIEPILGDASKFALPAEPLVLFLFHPFDSPIMKAVARHALASWKATFRPIRVVYVNPVYLRDWTEAGWIIVVNEGFHAVLAPEKPR